MTTCPCGSSAELETCCGQYLDGVAAPTAEKLMRSRYTAFVLERGDYLAATLSTEQKKDFDIDEEEYKPYFEQNSVVNGLFEFLNKLFTIEFKEVNIELWDKKAKAFDIYHDNTLQA